MTLPNNMLCELANSFPPLAAKLLQRDEGLTRNFREETVTDLLMASLVSLSALGIRVDFPNEPFTGGDMDWIFAAPFQGAGGRYIAVRLQAKRAQIAKRKKGDYWYYQHLDHDNGQQAQMLVKPAPGVLPLYIFYNPLPALSPAARKLPAIEGVNLVSAHLVANAVTGKCGIKVKKVDIWRPHFMPLSTLLCWPIHWHPKGGASTSDAIQFAVAGNATFDFHPDRVAERFRDQLGLAEGFDTPTIEAVDAIPAAIRRAIDGNDTADDRQKIDRPRVILTTKLRRDRSRLPEMPKR